MRYLNTPPFGHFEEAGGDFTTTVDVVFLNVHFFSTRLFVRFHFSRVMVPLSLMVSESAYEIPLPARYAEQAFTPMLLNEYLVFLEKPCRLKGVVMLIGFATWHCLLEAY